MGADATSAGQRNREEAMTATATTPKGEVSVSTRISEPRRRTRAWEIHAQARIEWLRTQLIGLHGRAAEAARTELTVAESYVSEPTTLPAWLGGRRVEGAWTSIHSAHALLVEATPAERVRALLPAVEAAAAAYLPPNHAERKALHERLRENKADDPVFVANVLRTAYEFNGESYVRLRRYRNVLLGSAMALFVVVVALALFSAKNPGLVSTCFDGINGAKTTRVCPTGRPHSTGGDVALLAAFGAIGGALSGTRSLARSTTASVSAYSLRVSRALLKVAVGGVTAVLGVVFVRAGFSSGLTAVQNQAGILAYAVIFGSAQQFITKLVDEQAENALATASTNASTPASKKSTADPSE